MPTLEWVRLRDVSRELGVHRITLYRWIRHGFIDSRRVGRMTFISRPSVERFINGQRANRKQGPR